MDTDRSKLTRKLLWPQKLCFVVVVTTIIYALLLLLQQSGLFKTFKFFYLCIYSIDFIMVMMLSNLIKFVKMMNYILVYHKF